MRGVKMTLGAYPSKKIIQQIVTWLKREVGEDVVLDWEVDTNVVAGARIAFEGKYGDFSVAENIEQFFRDHLDKVKECLAL